MNEIKIIESNNSNFDQIMDVERSAFGEEEEAELTKQLLSDSSAEPIVSLLAFDKNKAIGHILFTLARLSNSRSNPILYILAPLAVIPEYQKKGIGGKLIIEGLKKLKKMKVDLVFVLGHISYYPKYGFINNASKYGFQATYPIPDEVRDAWMVQELTIDAINTYSGKVQCCKAMDKEEYWKE